LKEGKAKVVYRKPLTIQLLYGSFGYRQPVTLGVDAGYSNIGLSAIKEKQELFSAEVKLRTDIVKLNSERRQYRRTRRSRKTWYRKPRFLNRGNKKEGWLSPSIQHKLDSHVQIIEKVKDILPVSKIVVEVSAFDIQKIKNPNIEGQQYQEGEQSGFWNERQYVLHRDNHTCQHCRGKSKDQILEVHHVESRQVGGNRAENLITLCRTCHKKVSKGKFLLKVTLSNGFKGETFMSMVRWKLINRLQQAGDNVFHTYGYLTKHNRIQQKLPKSHANDAFVIAEGTIHNRVYEFKVNQNRRNNRSLQTNRKGFRPSIRKQRYSYGPNDLVKIGDKIFTVKGVFNYGKWIRLVTKFKEIKNIAISKVSLLKYQRGLIFGY
jgi:N6-L-threonylcarbamoyladenine synthase